MANRKNSRRESGAQRESGARTAPSANLYAAHFTDDELARIIAQLADPAA